MTNPKPEEPARQHGQLLLDRGLFVGPILAVFGLLSRDASISAAAAYYWLFSYAYCAPWMARSVRLRRPPQDHHLVAAALSLASLPWGLFLLAPDALSRPDVLGWAVLAAMAPGAAAFLAGNLTWRPRVALWRSVLIVGGGLAYVGWAAGYVWIAAGALAPEDWPPLLGLDSRGFFIAAVFMLPMPFVALWMAVRTLVGPLEDPASPQP